MAEDIGKTLGLLFVLVVLIILTGFGIFQTSVGTLKPLSIDQIDITGDTSFWKGSTFEIAFLQGDLGTNFYGGIFDDDDLGEDVQGSFLFTVNYDEQDCVYDLELEEDATPIIGYKLETWICSEFLITNSLIEDELLEKADELNVDPDTILWGGRTVKSSFSLISELVNDCYFIYKASEHEVGTISDEDVRVTGTFDMSVFDGEKETKESSFNFDSMFGQRNHYFCQDGDDCDPNDEDTFAYLEYDGRLDLDSCETPNQQYRAAYHKALKKWIITSQASYNDYVRETSNSIKDIKDEQNVKEITEIEIVPVGSAKVTINEYDDFVDDLNEWSIAALTDKTSTVGDIEEESSLENSRLVIGAGEEVVNPLFTLFIKADSIGWFVGTPKISVVDTEDVKDCVLTGEEGKIPITLKNDGTVPAHITFTGECESGFDITTEEHDLGAEQEQTFYIDFSVDVSRDITAGCAVRITEPASGFDKTVSSEVKGCEIGVLCSNKGAKYCDDDDAGNSVIRQCSVDGNDITLIETCQSDQTCTTQDGDAKCLSKEVGEDEEELATRCKESYINWVWLDCDKCDSKLATLKTMESYCKLMKYDISFFSGLLIGIVAFGFSFLYFNMLFKVQRTESRIILGILSLTLGFIAFIISNTLIEHWIISLIVALIILVFGVIAKKFIPFI